MVRVASAKSILPVRRLQILVVLIEKDFGYVVVLHHLGTKIEKLVADARVVLALSHTTGTTERLR